MYKILISIVFIILVSNYNLHSERLFDNMPPNGISKYDLVFDINDATSIDSINLQIDFIKNNYQGKSYTKNPYTYINFKNLNEIQIDSAIAQLIYKEYIVSIAFTDCQIEKLPDFVKKLQNLYSIGFYHCDLISSLNGFNSVFSIFELIFSDCRINKLPEGIEKLKPMLNLKLDFPDDFNDFDLNKELSKFKKRKNILDLFVYYKLTDKFPQSLFNLTSMQILIFYSQNIVKYPPTFDKLVNLIDLTLTSDNSKVFESAEKNGILNNFRPTVFPKNSEESEKLKLMESNKNIIFPDNDNEPNVSYTMFFKRGSQEIRKFKFDRNSVIIQPDTSLNSFKINITKLKTGDSVTIKLTDINTGNLFKTIEYQNQEIIIDSTAKSFFMTIFINNKAKKWRILEID